jgi:hypothetical protein
MKTQVEFRSNKFPPYEGEEEEINPGLWGKRLAEYLKAKLEGAGIQTDGIVTEDWGCMVGVKNERFPLAIGCGHQDGEDNEFLCFIEPSKPVVRKWFKKIDTTQEVRRLSEALQTILASDPDIRDVRWQSEDHGEA